VLDPNTSSADRVFRFGSFELSERDGKLRKNGIRIKLQDQPFRVLMELLSNASRLVTREHLQQKLWPADTFVDFDVGLNTAIRKIRHALGDDADRPRYIETVARRGYVFLMAVETLAGGHAAARQEATLLESSSTRPLTPTFRR
jgi:DNA-binding winged helix-turn-helix (wHTH) protein